MDLILEPYLETLRDSTFPCLLNCLQPHPPSRYGTTLSLNPEAWRSHKAESQTSIRDVKVTAKIQASTQQM